MFRGPSPNRANARSLPLIALAAVQAIGCAADGGVRPVASIQAAAEPVEVILLREGELSQAEPPAPIVEETAEELVRVDVKGLVAIDAAFELSAEAEDSSQSLLGHGSLQLDAEAGPVDLGYPLLIDLGAGHAPYDDGVAPLAAEPLGRGGFSDSVIRFTWRERIAPATSLTGGAAFLRNQDSSVLEGLSDARFGFVVLGVELRL